MWQWKGGRQADTSEWSWNDIATGLCDMWKAGGESELRIPLRFLVGNNKDRMLPLPNWGSAWRKISWSFKRRGQEGHLWTPMQLKTSVPHQDGNGLIYSDSFYNGILCSMYKGGAIRKDKKWSQLNEKKSQSTEHR